MWQQGWSSIIIPRCINWACPTHSNNPTARLWRQCSGFVWLLHPTSSLYHPLCTCKLSATTLSLCGGSGTCLKTTSASPWWPAELSQLQNQGHAHRGPRFYHHKEFAATAACNWLQETFWSIFCQHCNRTLYSIMHSVFLSCFHCVSDIDIQRNHIHSWVNIAGCHCSIIFRFTSNIHI